MSVIEKFGLRALHRMDPEKAHGLAIKALQLGLSTDEGPVASDRLFTSLAGLRLTNPVGLAAGFDKNAEAVKPLSECGFGFLEVGAVTPRAQSGNAKPRLFRLSEDRAAINRFGFNNDGMQAVGARLDERPEGSIVGINLGANKDSLDRSADFSTVLAHTGGSVDFATVNVSSPNTEKLRDLQGPDALTALLEDVMETRDRLLKPIPIFLKIAPDLTDDDLTDIAGVAFDTGIDGIIATNTTLARDGLLSDNSEEQGGLSGAPLFRRSTQVVARMYQLTEGQIPLIGVGGVGSAQDAFDKIAAGATAVQLYTALVYGGISLARDIATGLDSILAEKGFSSVSEAVGHDYEAWL